MEEKLKKLMAEILNLNESEIKDSLKMKETDGWDSLKHMELIVAFEQEFDIELTVDEIVAMQDYKEIKRILEEKTKTN